MKFLREQKQGGSGTEGGRLGWACHGQWEVITRGNMWCVIEGKARDRRTDGEPGRDESKEWTNMGGMSPPSEIL